MTAEPNDAQASAEIRLTALEAAVAHLSALMEPAVAASHLASPVAVPLLKEAAQHEFSAKFFALIDVGESLIKYSTALALAAAVQNERPSASAAVELFKQPPTLGKWAEGLRCTLDDTLNTDWPVDVIREVFRRQNNRPTSTARYLLDEFIRIRNHVRGHGAQQPEGYYEDLYLRNHLNVHDCVRACMYLRLPLIHIHAIAHVGSQYSYKATILMGATPIGSPDLILSPVRAPVGSMCAWDSGARLLPLHDFVTYRYCKTCMLEHVFFADRITADRLSFHSYVGSHRLEVDRTGR
jgi:hypothetical protein